MATMGVFLKKSMEIETKIGDLYKVFAARFEENAQAKALFLSLADEEFNHARALQLLERIMRTFDGEVAVAVNFDEMADALLTDLDRALALLAQGRAVTLETALAMAAKIEANMIEEQRSSMLSTDNVEMLKTLTFLRVETERHKERLAEFLDEVKAAAS